MATEPRPFEPDWTLRPGVALAEILIDRHIGAEELAASTGLAPEVVAGVVHGTVPIDEVIAERLYAGLGISAGFWLNYQRNYDADLARGAKDVSDR